MSTAFDLYNQPLTENEIDLYTEVRNLLVNAGMTQQAATVYDANNHIAASVGKNEKVQRYHQNQFWNIQLLSAEKPSMEQRFCLIPNGNTTDWLRLFKAVVLPFCVANGLPKAI